MRHDTCDDVETAEPQTDFEHYTENNYGKVARKTNERGRERLAAWQIPAIRKHIGDLTGKVFIDLGAGDIVLGEKLSEIGVPRTFYVQDISRPSLNAGIDRIKRAGHPVECLVPLVSDTFDLDAIPDGVVDAAFSNSLFSHLSINSILLCLRRLAPKMKPGARYLSSMIVLPHEDDTAPYDWSYLETRGTKVISHPTRDPYHYTKTSIDALSAFGTGFEALRIHDYGHPFQKLVEFKRNDAP